MFGKIYGVIFYFLPKISAYFDQPPMVVKVSYKIISFERINLWVVCLEWNISKIYFFVP